MEHHLLDAILILLLASVVAVVIFRRLHLPPILGYLLVGVILGHHGLGLLDEHAAADLLGEIGVAFLLFSIGLEFSIPQFMAMRRTLLGLGGAQVLLGTLSGGLIAWGLGIPLQGALIVGGALSMSSTAILVKQLTEQLELQSAHGRLVLGILLFQDLAAVPFLVVIPIFAAGGDSLLVPLFLALLKGALALVVMLGLGKFALRPLFHEVARGRSSELFTLTVLLVSLLAAWLTALLGLSLALGAFLAGMMLSETEYRHQIEAAIRPFRDVLLGLFFVIVGTELNLAVLPGLWPWITLLVAGLILGKGPLIVLLSYWASRDWPVAVRTGVVLAHGGEFGFALLALAWSTGLLSGPEIQPILAAAVITMTVAPILVRHNEVIAKYLLGQETDVSLHAEADIAEALHDQQGHVIICGFGRVGQHMARLLRTEGYDYVALDMDPVRVKLAWEDGQKVFYGDASHPEILLAAGLERCRVLVISYADVPSAMRILHTVKQVRPGLAILVRTRDDLHLRRLKQAGASEVVPEVLEASLMLATQLFLLLDLPMERVEAHVQGVRKDRYRLLDSVIQGSDPGPRTDAESEADAHQHL